MTTAIAFKLDGDAEAEFPALSPPAETAHVIATDAEAIDVAKQVAAEFHVGAAARDRDKRLPIAEIDRYSQSGLWSLNVPKAFGGPELSYATIARATAIIAATDPSLAQVTQNHIDFVDTVRTTGSDAQKKYFFDLVLRGYRTGNAFSEFGSRTAAEFQTRIAPRGDDFTVNGRKFYCSGALLAHLVPITALDDSGKSYIAVADRRAGGLTIFDDWSSFGQRTTASGTAIIDNLIVPSSHVLRTYTAEDAPSVNGVICQIIHAAVDQGIAQGAIDETLAFVRGSSRPWIDSGKDYAHEDPYTISAVGDLFIRLHAAEALLERAGRFVDIAVTEPSLTNVGAVLQETAARGLGETRHFDLIDVGPDFATAAHANELGAQARHVKTEIEQADVLVVGSPIYKGAYTGLFKHFFDLLDPLVLTDKPVILTTTGGSNRHALVIESHLRPLFSFFNVISVPAGVFATEADFISHDEVKPSLTPRISEAVGQLQRLLPLRRANTSAACASLVEAVA